MVDAILRILRSILCKTTNSYLPEPTSTGEIGYDELDNLLKNLFPDASIFLSDKIYKTCSLSDIMIFLKQDNTNRIEYEAESFDCDDFSYRLMGQFSVPPWAALAFGICWTDVHALNCFVDYTRKFRFIEPHTDETLTELKSWMGHSVRLIIM